MALGICYEASVDTTVEMLTAEEAARMDEEDNDGDDGDDDRDGADRPVLPFSGIAKGAATAPPASPP